jgi:GNAT superfamily N-acetyltransferase
VGGRVAPAADLDRFFALERRLLERLSTRVEPFEHGTVFLDEEYRDRYVSNFLLADRSIRGLPASALVDDADRILGGAGFAHRNVVVRDDREGSRLAPGFVEHGYVAERNVAMAHRRTPDRGPDLPVEACAWADVRPLLLEQYRREPWADAEIAHAFTEQHGKSERVIGARFFAARVDGALGGGCELYVDGPDAQVENVATLQEHRGRGVARAVVLAAVEAARDAGAEHVFIVADDADWPKELYARLGFDRLARTWQFTRWPDPPARSAQSAS